MRTAVIVLLLALNAAACGSDRSGDPGGGTDAGPRVRVDAGPSGGSDSGPSSGVDSGPSSGVDSGAPPAMGACTNASDTMLMMMHDMEMVTGDCAEGCFGGADCTRDCVIERTMISMPCAQCWGNVVGCTSSMCAFECLGGETPGCATCRDERGCTAAFQMCSGLME